MSVSAMASFERGPTVDRWSVWTKIKRDPVAVFFGVLSEGTLCAMRNLSERELFRRRYRTQRNRTGLQNKLAYSAETNNGRIDDCQLLDASPQISDPLSQSNPECSDVLYRSSRYNLNVNAWGEGSCRLRIGDLRQGKIIPLPLTHED